MESILLRLKLNTVQCLSYTSNIKIEAFLLYSSIQLVERKKKHLAANAGDVRDVGSISGLGRSPGGGIDNPFQCSCLEISTDRGALWTTIHKEWGRTECSHMHMIYRARSYHFTINTTHKNPVQWVIILQLRDVEGLPHNQREAKTPASTSSCFLCLHLRGICTGRARRRVIPSFPSRPTILLSPAEAWTEVRLASCWVMSRFTGLVKEAMKSD